MKTIHIPRRFVLDAWGGTETVVLETCRRLPGLGIESTICCPSALSSPGPDAIESVPIQRFPYFYPYLGLSAESKAAIDLKGGNLFSFSLLRHLLKTPELDLIHLHTAKRLGGIGRTAARMRKIPYVITVHGGMIDVPEEEAATWTAPTQGTWEWGKSLGMLVGSRRVLDDAAAIICVDGNEAKNMAALYPAKRVVALPNGVDPEPYQSGTGERFREHFNIPADKTIILNVSRIDPQKNQKMALETLALVRKGGVDAHLVLIGPVTNHAYHKSLEAAVNELGLNEHVLIIPGFPPRSEQLYNAYAAADVFLLSSVHEPFGIVILEAWAAGIPVVAAAVGGIPDFTHDQKDILLFTKNDAAQAAEQVLSLIQNPELCLALKKASTELIQEKYHWNTVTRQLADLYQDVANDKVGRP